MSSHQPWYHGNITRSTAEDLLSKAAKDGSFLLRDSESIQGAYALCVLYQNCVYTYRILPNEEKKLSVQASDGVPIRFFTVLSDLVEAYYKENMGLVTHLQYPVQKEEEPEEEPEAVSVPPLPPRNVPANENRDGHSDLGRALEPARPCILDTYYQRLQHVDMSHLCEDHQKAIQDYFCSAVGSDADQVQNGNPTLPNLKKLITTILLTYLQSFISTIFSSSQTKNAVFDSVGYEGGHRKSIIPPVTFEVKTDSLSISNKMFLKVDVEGGKVYFKKSKDGPEDKYFVHNKILQLVKSQKIHPKLVIVVETDREKTQRKEFVFNDSKKREGFCQLLQQMKNKHSGKPEPDMITIFVGTWNMGNASPSQNISSWFQSKGQGKTRDDTANQIPHDIYVIGTQEDPLGEKEWIDILRGALRDITNISFKLIATQTLWNIRIVVLAKPEHENRISHIFSDSVKTGIANALGNKGAVGVSFMFNGTSFGFVNSHLTSGSEKKIRRNQNYVSILRFLNLGDKKVNPFDITHRFTHLFWLGDLNYRVELPTTVRWLFLFITHYLCLKDLHVFVILAIFHFLQINALNDNIFIWNLGEILSQSLNIFQSCTVKIYRTSQKFGHTFSFSVFNFCISFLRCKLILKSEDGQPPEMFDNPLYGLMGKSQSSKDQENPRKAHLTPPEIFAFPKPPDTDNDRPPPVPTPRNRSYTCSDSKPSSPASTTTASISSNNSLQPQSYSKKPVVPSRSDAGMMAAGKPPLPMKFRPGQPDSQPQPQPQPKPRDYRDTAELPSKIRLPTRLVQPLPKDGMMQ
uniref:phosphatidylinositol-3,4,5-trisphosphate 5-phosphatase n=1 Tax=Astyanax mexicanus TaxID=7994 RepID=A0A8B9KUK2_ASTMX